MFPVKQEINIPAIDASQISIIFLILVPNLALPLIGTLDGLRFFDSAISCSYELLPDWRPDPTE
jgi:hypothetical protein